MKPTILLQLDPDAQPSVFDAVTAIDAGVQHVLRHGGVQPADVRALVHGALFTRGLDDLKHTAVFVGGSDVGAGEALFKAVREAFFGPFQVSVLFDANGCNTTAAAAVLAALEGINRAGGSTKGLVVAVLGATGPVGQRVARLFLGQEAGAEVRVGSRRSDRAQAVAGVLKQTIGREAVSFGYPTREELQSGLSGAHVVIAAGAAGAQILPRDAWPAVNVLVDLNAVPPAGIEGIDPSDKGTERDGVLCWGALGVGSTKMRIHKAALRELFTSNKKTLDAEECLELARGLT